MAYTLSIAELIVSITDIQTRNMLVSKVSHQLTKLIVPLTSKWSYYNASYD